MERYRFKPVLIFTPIITLSVLLYLAVETNIVIKLYLIFPIIVNIYFFSINTTTYCSIDEEKFKFQRLFKSKTIYWKEIRGIVFNEIIKPNKENLYLLDEEDLTIHTVSNMDGTDEVRTTYRYNLNQAISVSYMFRDYEEIYKIIYEKFKDNEGIFIDSRLIDFCRDLN
ncbi:MAG TPA: hypothetical protein VIK72_04395 [Clostridiaceae bacterium]